MKLKYKITLLLTSIAMISVLSISTMAYFHVGNYSNNVLNNYLQARLDSITNELDEFILIRARTVETIVNMIENTPDPSHIARDFLKASEIDPYISDIYIGFENGTIISGKGWTPETGYDPRKRDWYIDTKKAGKLFYTDSYLDLATKKNTISICAPIKDTSGNTVGVITEDLLLESLTVKVIETNVENIGYAMLIDKNGMAVAHPDKDIMGTNLLENKEIGTVISRVLAEKYGSISYTYNNEDKIMLFRPMSSTGWIVGVTVDKAEVYKPIYNLVKIFIISSMVILLLVLLISLYFSKNLAKPITFLKNQAIRFSNGNLSVRVPVNGKDEVAELSSSFNEMAEKLTHSIEMLSDSEEKYKNLVENSTDFIYSFDSKGRITAINEAFRCLLNMPQEEILRRRISDLKSIEMNLNCLNELHSLMLEKKSIIKQEAECMTNSGIKHTYDVVLSPVKNSDGIFLGATGAIRDITALKNYQNYIQHIAFHDTLTGLPNRAMLIDKIENIIVESAHNNTKIAVILLDLDNFKKINDTLGHSTGDMVIVNIASRILSMKNDNVIVSRFGGDEFIIILKNMDHITEISDFSSNLLKLFQNSFSISDNELYITASVGISIFPNDTRDFEKLLMYADAAMYKAKHSGKNSYYFYDDSINRELSRKVWIENGLRRALDNNEFELYFQPIVNLKTDRICGAEALIRWIPESNDIISPMEFIPVAEETGQIHLIGKWVLQTACEKLKKWKSEKVIPEDFILSVNMSPVQLKKQDIVHTISRIINDMEVDPNTLEIEITEGVFINEFNEANKILDEIRNLGIRIALDDFGTGFSSLSYLKELNINTLKIDKLFVRDILQESKNKVLAGPIISLVHNLNIEIIAEGVETLDQLSYLKDHFCNKAQGFIFSKPLRETQFRELLSSNKTFFNKL